ncbi:uncharacterized protein N7496_006732 [Penicillium cataractarum]|uniref:Uncharacterized protein n=1 Tax=Penicillium cataractarum TaxID=2100454 RepID=A0A9W9S2E5_9EURO|nr:uncharacterized protein N7496_006732 [Penicillium cataractarum]KAJ5370640.1 hypothetical protein N7496_006732 [Penicillium cataractarum]
MTTCNLANQSTIDAQEKQPISQPQAQAQAQPQPEPAPSQPACNPQTDNAGHVQDAHILLNLTHAQELPAEPINYEGYQFFKADPIPGQKPSWTRVERTRMHLSQSEFYKLVHKRANKTSAAHQYQKLSATRRAHVNQLIHEQKKLDPSVEWSCVYAKERDRASKARNAHRADYETVSMEIILMKRPLNNRPYPRTPMGDLVDLAQRQNENDMQPTKPPLRRTMTTAPIHPAVATAMWISKDLSMKPDPTTVSAGVVQGPQPRPIPVTNPFTCLELGQHTPVPSEQRQHYRPINRQTTTDNNRDCNNDDIEEAESSAESSDSEDANSMSEDSSESDGSSSTEEADPDDMERDDCEEPQHQSITVQNRSGSPNKRTPIGHGSQYRQKSRGRHFGRRDKPRYHYTDILASKNGFPNGMPIRRARCAGKVAQTAPSDINMWYRIQRMDDQELRRRLLECEAKLERWEQAYEYQSRLLQQSIQDSQRQQLERCPFFWNPPPMPHYGYDYPNDGHMDDSN